MRGKEGVQCDKVTEREVRLCKGRDEKMREER